MYRINLHERFVQGLKEKFTRRSELVNLISEILFIEKESASRRLSGRVNFSVDEIGILACKLGISLDSLLYPIDSTLMVPFVMNCPKKQTSFDVVIEILEKSVSQHRELIREPAGIVTVFDSLPIEFFVHYPELCKFLYFKWGHFFVGTSEFKDYRNWRMPAKLDSLHKELMDCYACYQSAVYIWDNPVIWNLTNDIRYLLQIDMLQREDAAKIKADVHRMLDDVEGVASGMPNADSALENKEFYVSSINIGMTVTCITGKNRSMSFFKTFFVNSYTSPDRNFCMSAGSWINGMKKVSTLISGSGEKERTLFFKEQHRIVDTV